MQRRNNQMAGHRCAQGDRRGFLVANLANHQHLRILPQQMLERLGKRQTAFEVDLSLHDAWDHPLYRVLHCDHVAGIRLEQPL